MNKIVSIVSLAVLGSVLAACGGSDDAAEDVAMDAEPAMEAAAAAPTELTPGVSEVTNADGAKTTMTINDDGTYAMQPEEGLRVAGIAKMEDGKACFDPSGPDEAVCWTANPAEADGSYTATNDAGETVTVRPQQQ